MQPLDHASVVIEPLHFSVKPGMVLLRKRRGKFFINEIDIKKSPRRFRSLVACDKTEERRGLITPEA
jgi:hypothetical protein